MVVGVGVVADGIVFAVVADVDAVVVCVGAGGWWWYSAILVVVQVTVPAPVAASAVSCG